MASGWFKVDWSAKDHPKLCQAVTMGVWIHLLSRVYHKDKLLNNGNEVRRGELIISESAFADTLGLSRKVMRRILDSFTKDGMVEVLKRDRNGTHLSVCNWETYQANPKVKGQQRNTNETATEHERDINGTRTEQQRDLNERQSKSPKIPKSPKKKEEALPPTVSYEVIKNDALRRVAFEWISYKVDRKDKFDHQRAVNRISKLAEKHGDAAICDAIDRAIANGWQGFEHGLGDQSRGSPSSTVATEKSMIQRMIDEAAAKEEGENEPARSS